MTMILAAVDAVEQGVTVNIGQIIYLVLMLLLVCMFSILVVRVLMGSKQRKRAIEMTERMVELLESIDRKLDRND